MTFACWWKIRIWWIQLIKHPLRIVSAIKWQSWFSRCEYVILHVLYSLVYLSCFLSFFLFSHYKDSYLFLTSSLDALCSSLKTRMKPFSCSTCQLQPPFCQSCAGKKSAHNTFPWTVDFIESTFGLQHLEILLKKQYYPYRQE